MSNIVSIHQPNFLPWLPYLFKMNYADIHVCLDHVEFSKNGWTNRCCYLLNKDKKYFTIPIKKADTSLSIDKVRISKDQRHLNKIHKTVSTLSKKYPGKRIINEIWGLIFERIKTTERLVEINKTVQNYLRSLLGIVTPIEYTTSNLELAEFHKSELVKQICSSHNASYYLTGTGSYSYLEKDLNFSLVEITPTIFNLEDNEVNIVDFILKYGNLSQERFQEISASTIIEMDV